MGGDEICLSGLAGFVTDLCNLLDLMDERCLRLGYATHESMLVVSDLDLRSDIAQLTTDEHSPAPDPGRQQRQLIWRRIFGIFSVIEHRGRRPAKVPVTQFGSD